MARLFRCCLGTAYYYWVPLEGVAREHALRVICQKHMAWLLPGLQLDGGWVGLSYPRVIDSKSTVIAQGHRAGSFTAVISLGVIGDNAPEALHLVTASRTA